MIILGELYFTKCVCVCGGGGGEKWGPRYSLTSNLRTSEKAFTSPYTIFILLNATGRGDIYPIKCHRGEGAGGRRGIGLYKSTKCGGGRHYLHYLEPKV